jgi:hypothetical protein
VELALPSWVQQENMTGHVKDMTAERTARLQEVLKGLITHLSYLLKLSEAGFQLEIIAEEGFWSAWTLLQDTPSRDLFLLLSPPPTKI